MEHPRLPVPTLSEVLANADALGVALTHEQAAQAVSYLELLSRWNATTSLLQAGSSAELLSRHVAEGWIASRLIRPPMEGARRLRGLDVGSGGGIPAIPIRILRPDVALTLVEPRGRKAAFLRAVARQLGPPDLDVREATLQSLPASESFDFASFRGIHLEPAWLTRLLASDAFVIRFPAREDVDAEAWLRAGYFRVAAQDLPTPGLRVEAWQSSVPEE